ncbi:TPA: hypothetical protein QCY05_000861 [Bacillus wiedmannii]|nr:hypothetical protein [Bacillus wiedmannii]
MNKEAVIKYLENKFIKHGYVKKGCVIVEYFPRKIVEDLLKDGAIELQNTIIPTIILSELRRKQILETGEALWMNVTK